MNEPKISEAKFKIYEKIRRSGATNMMDWQAVQKIAFDKYHTFLDRKDVLEIIEHYSEYKYRFASYPDPIESTG